MTIRAMLDAPELFKVGVANNPAITNRESGRVIEPFLGTFDANPNGYRGADLCAAAARLEGKLLIIASALDPLFGSATRMVQALIEARKDFDLVILPDQDHTTSGQPAQFMLRKRAVFLAQHLGV